MPIACTTWQKKQQGNQCRSTSDLISIALHIEPEMAACRQRSCWSEFPRDLLSCIAQSLDSRLHVFRFRGICSSLRASVPLPPKSPTLPKQLRFRGNYPTRKHNPSFVIWRMNVYGIRRPGFEAPSDQNCWFIKVEETKQSNKFRVLSPFSQHPIKNLPASFPKELNLLSFCVEETVNAFSIWQRREDPDIDVLDSDIRFRDIANFDGKFKVSQQGHALDWMPRERAQYVELVRLFSLFDLDNYHGSGVALVKSEISEAEEPKLSRSCIRPGNEEHGGENRGVEQCRRGDLSEIQTNRIVDDKQPFLVRWGELWKSNHLCFCIA
ncbi:hypothetical protein GQ457_01G006850 [Hibiscus cannabinus]